VDVEPDCGDDPRSLPQSAERTRFCTAAAVSLCLAMTAAIAGGVAASYIYDRANSKGDDLAVITGGLLAIGTFVFVILFPWLRTLHHKTSWRTPWLAWLVCLAGSMLITALLWPAGDFGPFHDFHSSGLDRDFVFRAGGGGSFPALLRRQVRVGHQF